MVYLGYSPMGTQLFSLNCHVSFPGCILPSYVSGLFHKASNKNPYKPIKISWLMSCHGFFLDVAHMWRGWSKNSAITKACVTRGIKRQHESSINNSLGKSQPIFLDVFKVIVYFIPCHDKSPSWPTTWEICFCFFPTIEESPIRESPNHWPNTLWNWTL